MTAAPAKLNLALVVGPRRPDGRHELATVLQQIALADEIELEAAEALSVEGFPNDTLVRTALESLAEAASFEGSWAVRIEKRIPIAAGLGGGSSDAAAALLLANGMLPRPLPKDLLHELACGIGADVPFFLEPGPKLGEADGTVLRRLDLPQEYAVLLVLPRGAGKASTGAVYEAFDEREGAEGFDERRAELERALGWIERAEDLGWLPPNDLASSPVAAKLRELGAFRADVSGAGPVVYGLFRNQDSAEAAERQARALGRTWVTEPAW